MNQTAFFDLWDIFANELIGSVPLMIVIGAVVILLVGIKSKIPYPVLGMLEIIWFGIIVSKTNILIIWIYIVLIAGAAFYYSVSKAGKRG